MKSFCFQVLLLAALLAFASPAAATPDQCAVEASRIAAKWPSVLRAIDKRTASEASKASKTGESALKAATTLLNVLAKRARSKGGRTDWSAARLVDRLVTQLKLLSPTATAVSGWADANRACDEVKLLANADPNVVCRPLHRKGAKVRAACRKCDTATARMQRLARGSRAGEHTIADLIEGTWEDLGALLEDLADDEFVGSRFAAQRGKAVTRTLRKMRAALKGTLVSSTAGEIAWEVFDDLRKGTSNKRTLAKMKMLPTWAKATRHHQHLKKACGGPPKSQVVVKDAGPTNCDYQCRNLGGCHFDPAVGVCSPTTPAHCAQSEYCKKRGWCSLVKLPHGNRVCAAASDQDCRKSSSCREWGQCSRVAARGSTLDGLCKAMSDADCRRSTACRDLKMCRARNGSCQ